MTAARPAGQPPRGQARERFSTRRVTSRATGRVIAWEEFGSPTLHLPDERP